MQIKRFEARSMTEALRQIKRELGAEAVILSAKDIKRENRLLGITRTLGVEVTAAVDTQEDGPGAAPARSGPDRGGRPAPPIFHGEDPGKGFIRRIQDVVSIRKSPPGGSSESPSREGESDRAAANLKERLLKRGLEEKWVLRLVDGIVEAGTESVRDEVGAIAAGLKSIGLVTRPVVSRGGRQSVFVLVGASGSGKTTAAAKLAARYRYRMKQSVGIVSLDGSRLGGDSLIAACARILDVGLERASMRGGLKTVIEGLADKDVVIVDTPAVNPSDETVLSYLTTQLAAVPSAEVLLVLDATTRRADLIRIADTFSTLRPHGVVLTKTDETEQIGDVVPMLVQKGLPTSFFGFSPQIPIGFEEATLGRWAARLSEGARDDTPSEPSEPTSEVIEETPDPMDLRFLANRSSDIFHRTDCRWIRFIHEANIIEFHSYADAVNHRFKPCRYCHPGASETGAESSPSQSAAYGNART